MRWKNIQRYKISTRQMPRNLIRFRALPYTLICTIFGITSLMYLHQSCDVQWRKAIVQAKVEAYQAGRQAGPVHEAKSSRLPFVPRSAEQIHIVEICHNKHSLHRLITFIKSLLFYRTNPINLHILTNENSVLSVRELFRTWNIAHFRVFTYVRPDVEMETRWIPYLHPAGHFAFKKLLLEKILPPSVNKVIFYDADIVMVSDIGHLWNIFHNFNSSQAIGMSYETQYWYKTKDGGKFEGAWPAIEWGFNTGMIMYDLAKLRKMNWPELWRKEAKQELKKQGFALLAEQDILNVYFLHHREIHYQVPCIWNVQFGERFNLESCPDLREYKALHTTLSKLEETDLKRLPSLPVFNDIVRTFIKLDGGQFSKSGSGPSHRVFPYYFDFDYVRDFGATDVALVLYVTFNMLKDFQQVVDSWKGPMSVALYGTDEQALNTAAVPMRPNIAYHFVFRRENEMYVPEQLLVNIATKLVHTTHFVLGDVKFLTCKDAHAIMRNSLRFDRSYTAMPSFQMKHYVSLPNWNKASIIDELNRQSIEPVGDISKRTIEKWTLSDTPFVSEWNPFYPKYVMIPTKSHPVFSEENQRVEYEGISSTNQSYVQEKLLIASDCFALRMLDVIDPSKALNAL